MLDGMIPCEPSDRMTVKKLRIMDEADEISNGDLEAAAFMYDAVEKDGWAAWVKRNEEAARCLSSSHTANV